MAKRRGKPWEQNWEVVAPLPGGGHGSTSIVRQRGGGRETYVLKTLNRQRVLERRERMHNEVKALQRLQHNAIPKIVESNTDAYSDLSVELYFVKDYVDGPTLDERVASPELEPVQPDEAVRFVIRLSEILIYCHNEGFLHRDIKPNNILLRDGKISDPVLIDFGLSFNEDDSARSPLTPEGQPIGNRFLSLPELQADNSTKRYKESDIAQVCGVLFYILTGKHPVMPEDHERRKPHKREPVKKVLDDIGSGALEMLFDRGFEYEPAKRFHSFEAFKGYLHDVLDEFQQARPSNQNASMVTLEAVMPNIRTNLSNVRQESVRDEQATANASKFLEHSNFGAPQADALMFATLLGSWSERSEGDRDVIRRLIEGDD